MSHLSWRPYATPNYPLAVLSPDATPPFTINWYQSCIRHSCWWRWLHRPPPHCRARHQISLRLCCPWLYCHHSGHYTLQTLLHLRHLHLHLLWSWQCSYEPRSPWPKSLARYSSSCLPHWTTRIQWHGTHKRHLPWSLAPPCSWWTPRPPLALRHRSSTHQPCSGHVAWYRTWGT